MIDPDQFISESLEYGDIERGTKVALIVLLSLFPVCPRCPEGSSDADALTKAWWGNPVTHTDANGPTCYEHAALDAVPVENWRAILFANVARSLPGDDVDSAAHEAIHNALDRLVPGKRASDVGRAVRIALRAYASRWGAEEDVAQWASEVPAKAERLGLGVYAVVANDPRIRPAEVTEAFATYRRLRWPKGGDPCPDRFCKGVMVSVATGTQIRGEDPKVYCPVHKAEEDRRAALTPEERKREDDAARERLRAKLRTAVKQKKAERDGKVVT